MAFLVLISSVTAWGQSPTPDRTTTDLDWTTGTLRVTVERNVSAVGPTAISQTQRSIRRDAAAILVRILSDLPYDSERTLGGLVEEEEALISAIERAAGRAEAVQTSASSDLDSALVTFEIDLYRDLGTELVDHARPAPIEQRLGWIPNASYTGILIYAADRLPLFGTQTRTEPEPTLFPGIYYLSGPQRLIYRLAEIEHFEPERLPLSGPVAYTGDVQATGLADRIGPRPLRILAVAAFGTYPTDIVISEEDARRIMASEHNRSLLRDGRIAVVLSPERL